MNQLKAGAALNYLSIALNMVIGLSYTPYMLRMLGKSEYGLYSLAASIIAYLTILDLGFGNAIVRYTAKFRAEGKLREQQEMFGMFLVLYAGVGLLVVAGGLLLTLNVGQIFSANMTPEEVSRTRIMLWLMTFNLAFTFPMSIWGSIMTAYERFVFQRLVSITRSVLNPLVMVALLAVGYKAVAMVVVTTVFNVFTLVINYVYCRRKLHVKIRLGRFNPAFLKEVAVYSFWIFLNAIMDRIYWSTGQFVLGIFRGAAAVAVYAVAIQLQQIYMMFSTAVSGVFLPRVTAMVATGKDDRAISDLFIRTGRIQYAILVLILSGFVLFGQPFIRLWAGAGYEEAYAIALLFFVPLTVPLIQNLGIVILQARNQMKFRSVLYVLIAIASLGLSIPMTKLYGGIGCAVATALALTLGQIIIMNIYYQRRQRLDMFRFWCEIGKMSVIPLLLTFGGKALFMETGWDLTAPGNFLLAVAAFIVIYIPLFWHFSLNSSERQLLWSPMMNILRRK